MILLGLYKVYQRYTHLFCYLAFMINALVNSNVISLFFPLSMLVYALLETPRPHKYYWNTVFVYTILIVTMKFIYQISIFCVCSGVSVTWALQPTCGLPQCQFAGDPNDYVASYPRLIGIEKFNSSFFVAILPDLLTLLSIFMHRVWLKHSGYWTFSQRLTFNIKDQFAADQLKREKFALEKNVLAQQRKREDWTATESDHFNKLYDRIMTKVKTGNATDLNRQQLHILHTDLQDVTMDNPLFQNATLSTIYPEDPSAFSLPDQEKLREELYLGEEQDALDDFTV